jgi:hypothetical protein
MKRQRLGLHRAFQLHRADRSERWQGEVITLRAAIEAPASLPSCNYLRSLDSKASRRQKCLNRGVAVGATRHDGRSELGLIKLSWAA